MTGFITLDTPICYVKAPDKKTSHDAHLNNKFGIKEITSITAVKEYFTDNTFELHITIVAMYFAQLPKAKVQSKNDFLRWPKKLVTIH